MHSVNHELPFDLQYAATSLHQTVDCVRLVPFSRLRIDWPRTNHTVTVFGDAAPFDDSHARVGY